MASVLRGYDIITINIYYMGLTVLSQTMTPLIVPLFVQHFVGEQQQGTYYGNLRLWSLMTALLVQSLMGIISDHSASKWGRRRPFIFIGTLGSLIIITAIGFTANLEGMTGYWSLFTLMLLMMFTANTAQAAVQGLIPDLVPKQLRGRYSGIKALFEVPIPLILVALSIGPLIAFGNYWAGLVICMMILLITMLITMLVPEKPVIESSLPIPWQRFAQLLLMTAIFTSVILVIGQIVKQIGNYIQVLSRTNQLIIMGVIGLVAMLFAVSIGVFFSIKIGVGNVSNRKTSFTWWVINRLAFLVGSTNIASFAVYFLQGRLGYQNEQAAGPASQLIMFVGVSILLFAYPSGWLADRIGRKPVVASSGIIASIGTLIILLAPSLRVIYIGAILLGIAAGIFYTTNWALGTDLVPKNQAGQFLGVANLAGAGAGAVGAYIGGPIADYFTTNYADIPGLGYVLLFSIYGIIFIFSVFALTKVRTSSVVV